MEKSLYGLCALYLVPAALCAGRNRPWPSLRSPFLLTALVAFAACLIFFPFGATRDFLDRAVADYRKQGEVVEATIEGVTGTLQYLRRDYLGQPYSHRLVTDGYSMTNRTCTYGRSLLERALEGGYNFLDAELATETCTVTCRFQEHLQMMNVIQNPKFFCSFIDVPHKKGGTTYEHYRLQLQKHDRLRAEPFKNIVEKTVERMVHPEPYGRDHDAAHDRGQVKRAPEKRLDGRPRADDRVGYEKRQDDHGGDKIKRVAEPVQKDLAETLVLKQAKIVGKTDKFLLFQRVIEKTQANGLQHGIDAEHEEKGKTGQQKIICPALPDDLVQQTAFSDQRVVFHERRSHPDHRRLGACGCG